MSMNNDVNDVIIDKIHSSQYDLNFSVPKKKIVSMHAGRSYLFDKCEIREDEFNSIGK